jgi:hypothetical protein
MKNLQIRICPQCKSNNVTQRGIIGKGVYSNNYVCLTCGFQSPIFPEIDAKDAKKLPDGRKNFTPSILPIFAGRLIGTKEETKKYKIMTIISLTIAIIVLIFLILFR